MGFIGESSKILDKIPEGIDITDGHLTTSEEVKKFIETTGIDLVAPAVGNLHGMLRSVNNPTLNIERIKELRETGGVPMVLHGGSGITDEDFIKAIDAGISLIHISTEIRVAYKDGIKIGIQENPDEVAPYRYMKEAIHRVEKVVEEKLRLFNKLN